MENDLRIKKLKLFRNVKRCDKLSTSYSLDCITSWFKLVVLNPFHNLRRHISENKHYLPFHGKLWWMDAAVHWLVIGAQASRDWLRQRADQRSRDTHAALQGACKFMAAAVI